VNFEFAAPPRILFGEGRVAEAPAIVAGFGSRAVVVQGRSPRAQHLLDALRVRGVAAIALNIPGEPTTTLIERAAEQARDEKCDVVVALGGGSVIDSGKAIAALLTNRDPIANYLEVVGKALPLTNQPAPFVAIPTTAGTGAEATRNAVLMVEDREVKVSLRSPLMIPSVAIIDPELTYTVPPDVTASTGLDALTQCIEPFVAPQANPLTDAVAREGMRRAATSLRRAFHDGSDADARRDMCVASLCSGLALANAKLGAVHGFAAPLCGMFPIPHGVACARLLPLVVEANIRAINERARESPALGRYHQVAQILTGEPYARAEDAIAWLRSLDDELGVPKLRAYEVRESDIARIVPQARRASSMQGNPIVLTDEELGDVLRQAM
jgi:alcohol dehydrogenase class IV